MSGTGVLHGHDHLPRVRGASGSEGPTRAVQHRRSDRARSRALRGGTLLLLAGGVVVAPGRDSTTYRRADQLVARLTAPGGPELDARNRTTRALTRGSGPLVLVRTSFDQLKAKATRQATGLLHALPQRASGGTSRSKESAGGTCPSIMCSASALPPQPRFRSPS